MPLPIYGKILISWAGITVASLSLFVLSRNTINAHRQENMRARQRMRRSNEGEYPDSYRRL